MDAALPTGQMHTADFHTLCRPAPPFPIGGNSNTGVGKANHPEAGASPERTDDPIASFRGISTTSVALCNWTTIHWRVALFTHITDDHDECRGNIFGTFSCFCFYR